MDDGELYFRLSCAILALAVHFNGSVVSWWRTAAHNEREGGHPRSLHLRGLAVDMVFDTPGDAARAARWAERNGLFFQPKGSAIHFQMLPPLPESDAS